MNLSPRTHNRRPSFRRIALGLLFLTLVYGTYTTFRARKLLKNGGEIERHSAQFSRDYTLGESKFPALTYLVMGDSTAAGWGAKTEAQSYPFRVAQAMAARGFRVHVVNCAVGGATMGDVRRSQLASIARVRPDLITLSAGANDATHFRSEIDFERGWNAVKRTLEGSTARRILVANVPDLSLAPALPLLVGRATNARGRRFNAILSRNLAAPRWALVDLHGRGKLDFTRQPELYAADLFHPSGAGYAIWAELFIRSLSKANEFAARKSRQPALTKSRCDVVALGQDFVNAG